MLRQSLPSNLYFKIFNITWTVSHTTFIISCLLIRGLGCPLSLSLYYLGRPVKFAMLCRKSSVKSRRGSVAVHLNVYDLTSMNGYAYWLGLGVYHSGVQGEEYLDPRLIWMIDIDYWCNNIYVCWLITISTWSGVCIWSSWISNNWDIWRGGEAMRWVHI